MTTVEDLELQLKGLVLVHAILDWRGVSNADLQRHSEEIRRVRARIAEMHGAKGGGAHSVAA
jgi:hypothetical protein